MAGSSAGGHLAVMTGLTAFNADDASGPEPAGVGVAAVITMYPYLGPVDGSFDGGSSPHAHVRPDAPPFLVVHGDRDSIVPVEDARAFVQRLRSVSTNPVVYAELPGAQHGFDLFRSIRFDAVVDAVECFVRTVGVDSPDVQLRT
jgi:acetyl esterase/lipase